MTMVPFDEVLNALWRIEEDTKTASPKDIREAIHELRKTIEKEGIE